MVYFKNIIILLLKKKYNKFIQTHYKNIEKPTIFRYNL